MNSPVRILQDKGIRPRRQLGQSFLQDLNIAKKIVDCADIRSDETVVEIGAGLGIMTALIAARARRVIALDVDPKMIGILQERLGEAENIDIVHTDVLKYDFSTASPGSPEKIKIVGNVPYNISSPLLFYLLDCRRCISAMILMLQREVADRIVASPRTKAYGIPAVLIAMFCRVQRLFDVSAGCFFPEPKVLSSVVRIEPREKPLIDLDDEELFRNVVRMSFAKRRKTLANNFRHAARAGFSAGSPPAALRHANIDGTRRAEDLSPTEFGRLANALFVQENT